MSGASPFDDPEEDLGLHSLGEAVEGVLRARGLDDAVGLAELTSAWPSAVGAELSVRARPVGLRRDTLVVEVDDGAWATQVRLLADGLLESLSRQLKGSPPRRIEVRIGRSNTS